MGGAIGDVRTATPAPGRSRPDAPIRFRLPRGRGRYTRITTAECQVISSGSIVARPSSTRSSPSVEAVLEAVGIVRRASVEDDAGEERVAAALDQTLDVGDLGLHPLLLVETGATDGLLLGELLERATTDEGVERFDHHEHLVDLEAETVDRAEHLLVAPSRVRSEDCVGRRRGPPSRGGAGSSPAGRERTSAGPRASPRGPRTAGRYPSPRRPSGRSARPCGRRSGRAMPLRHRARPPGPASRPPRFPACRPASRRPW